MNNVASPLLRPSAQGHKPDIKSSDKAHELLMMALAAFEQWRSKKKLIAEPIPEELWQRIFFLESHYSPAFLRRSFKLNIRQYMTKREALFSTANPPPTPVASINPIPRPTARKNVPPAVPFCEVKIKRTSPYEHEPLPSGKTLIVELCRSDGQTMKVHTTQDSIPLIMQQFLGG